MGNYVARNEDGHERAASVLRAMRETGNPTILGHLVKEMIAKGEYGAVEIGFFHRLAEELIADSNNREAHLRPNDYSDPTFDVLEEKSEYFGTPAMPGQRTITFRPRSEKLTD